MKRTTLLHAELSRVIATMGHGDLLVIGDAGLPVPAGTPCIDLAVMRGVPAFADVLQAVLSELQVERATIAQEACGPGGAPPGWCRMLQPVVAETVPHARFKQLCASARAVVRTGECTPYTSVALYAGVVF